MTDGRNVISPRMDFEEWTPLGRGDPLKNDPTFDYLPPVLDKVHYWKSPPAATNRAHYYSSVSTATPTTPPSQAVYGGYNRRFFLTDFSKREPVQAVAYATIKRPPLNNNILQPHHHYPHNHHHPQQQQQQNMQHHLQTLQAVSAAGYHYSMHPASPVPRTPLPMLTPPPYQQWPATVDSQRQPLTSSSSSPDLPGNAVAESKQPPLTMIRAPTRLVPASSHHSAVIKALLDDEVDRTAITTTGSTITGAVWMTTMMTTTSTPPPPPPSPSLPTTTTTPPATSTAARTTPPVAVTEPLFSHYRQSPVTGRPMYLIIQGHSKVKTYGLASKLDDLTAAPAAQDHNHIGNQPPDEPSRRKRDHYHGTHR